MLLESHPGAEAGTSDAPSRARSEDLDPADFATMPGGPGADDDWGVIPEEEGDESSEAEVDSSGTRLAIPDRPGSFEFRPGCESGAEPVTPRSTAMLASSHSMKVPPFPASCFPDLAARCKYAPADRASALGSLSRQAVILAAWTAVFVCTMLLCC